MASEDVSQCAQLFQYIESALESVEGRAIDDSGFPTPMFAFVREMMMYHAWSDTYREDPDLVADAVERAWAQCQDGEDFWDTWEEYEDESFVDHRGHFVNVWLRMRCPPGSDPLILAAEYADQQPMTLHNKAPMLTNPHYMYLLNVCYHLQKPIGNTPVALPQDRLAQLVGKSQQTISGYLVRAERSGIIRRVSRHNFESHLAAKYRVSIEMFSPAV